MTDQSSDTILLAHGSGGKLSHQLVENVIASKFSNPILDALEDSARLNVGGACLAFTTDSYVVRPPVFPGGDIGRLAVCGTVNDLAVTGAKPLYLSCGLIIEEGFPLSLLETLLGSMQQAAREAGVQVVTGDTKVVAKGDADQIFVNTAGVGLLPADRDFSVGRLQPGDAIIISGTLGDHGSAVLSEREGFGFESSLRSDCAPLNGLIESLVAACDRHGEQPSLVHFMRDPTRGGVASTLNEIAKVTRLGVEIEESKIPVSGPVRGVCELLGLDPLYIANEGKLVVVVDAAYAEEAVEILRAHPLGADAACIGNVTDHHPRLVSLRTLVGGSRIVEMLVGDQLPRIC